LPESRRYNCKCKELKVKKTALALLLTGIGALVAPYVYASGTGSVEFNGKILESVCDVSPNIIKVPMGEISLADMKSGNIPEHSFEFRFENCPPMRGYIHVTFGEGHQRAGPERDLFHLSPDSQAEGVGIRIMGPNSIIEPGQRLTTIYRRTMSFEAAYALIGSPDDVKAGDANATVNFKVEYK
jgi:type 1 fimbria pilin